MWTRTRPAAADPRPTEQEEAARAFVVAVKIRTRVLTMQTEELKRVITSQERMA